MVCIILEYICQDTVIVVVHSCIIDCDSVRLDIDPYTISAVMACDVLESVIC